MHDGASKAQRYTTHHFEAFGSFAAFTAFAFFLEGSCRGMPLPIASATSEPPQNCTRNVFRIVAGLTCGDLNWCSLGLLGWLLRFFPCWGI